MQVTHICPANAAIKAVDYRSSKQPAYHARLRKLANATDGRPWELTITYGGSRLYCQRHQTDGIAREALKRFGQYTLSDPAWIVMGYPQLNELPVIDAQKIIKGSVSV
ncbi:MAG: hypothetical protein LBK46_10340 [Oscillospiraceae bacterium]|jgi:hypothetical protein|nr:hypothetical protein [Oscillospiraceae bacterium]